MCLSLSNILSDVVDETVSKSDFVLKEAAGNIMRKETWQTGIFGISLKTRRLPVALWVLTVMRLHSSALRQFLHFQTFSFSKYRKRQTFSSSFLMFLSNSFCRASIGLRGCVSYNKALQNLIDKVVLLSHYS